MSSRVSDAYLTQVEDRIVALYVDDGWSMRAIATHVNVGEETVRRTLQRNGVPSRKRGPVSPKYARDHGRPARKPRKPGPSTLVLKCSVCGAESPVQLISNEREAS
jgi:IS30 family transposase